MAPHPLIYDWNQRRRGGAASTPGRDAQRRDAARRPAVAVGPDADHRRADRDSASHGRARDRHGRRRPARRRAAGSRRTSSGWCARSSRTAFEDSPQLRRADLVADIKPIAEITQRTGVPIEVRRVHRVELDPAVSPKDGRSTSCRRCTEDALTFAVREGLTVMYVTEDTTRADPRFAAAAVFDGDPRGRLPPLHCRHGRTRDAERRQGARDVRQGAAEGTRTPRTSASTGTATGIVDSASRRASRPSRPARRGCTAPRSASASGAATRRSICCSSTW